MSYDPLTGRAYAQRRQTEHRARMSEIKLEAGCLDCGYAENPAMMDFDHRPGTVKLYDVSQMGTCKRARIDAETEKCDIRCRACHARRHKLEAAA